jgi:LysM repeat protein
VRRWRDSSPNQRGDHARGSGDVPIAGARRRVGPQAVSVRRGESRGAFHDEDESPPRPQRSVRRSGRARPSLGDFSNLPLEPRTLAIVGGAVVVLIVLAIVFTRGASEPASVESTPVPVAVTSPTSPTPAGPTAVPTQGPVQATIVPLEPSYTVQSGDTLAIIARRYNTTVDALVSINNLPDRNTLRVGQRLILPNQ